MRALVGQTLGTEVIVDPAYVTGHRWRYAFKSRSLGQPFLMNEDQTLCGDGDWCLGARAMDAWSSGEAIAKKSHCCLKQTLSLRNKQRR